jgi:predicted nucleic-acid-binding protein
MIGMDTNVLLRWLIAPDEGDVGSSKSEIEAVERVIRARGAAFYVNPIVIAETTWILERKLKLERGDVCGVLDRLLYSTNIEVGETGAVNDARQMYESANVGFADCLISCMNRAAGCEHTLTFDRKASRQAGFRNLHVKD